MSSLKGEIVKILENAGGYGYHVKTITQKIPSDETPQAVARVCRYSDDIEKADSDLSNKPYRWRLKKYGR